MQRGSEQLAITSYRHLRQITKILYMRTIKCYPGTSKCNICIAYNNIDDDDDDVMYCKREYLTHACTCDQVVRAYWFNGNYGQDRRGLPVNLIRMGRGQRARSPIFIKGLPRCAHVHAPMSQPTLTAWCAKSGSTLFCCSTVSR